MFSRQTNNDGENLVFYFKECEMHYLLPNALSNPIIAYLHGSITKLWSLEALGIGQSWLSSHFSFTSLSHISKFANLVTDTHAFYVVNCYIPNYGDLVDIVRLIKKMSPICVKEFWKFLEGKRVLHKDFKCMMIFI